MDNPISNFLAAELHTTIRRRGLVVWLDPLGQYGGFVERLRASAPSTKS